MSLDDVSENCAALAREGARQMAICSICRYCEGYCAVFPAVERRLAFDWADMTYLANLCHGCGECLFACQYAPPHEFAVDVPKSLAQTRLASYQAYAWPQPVARAFGRDAIGTAVAFAVCLAGGMLLTSVLMGPGVFSAVSADGDFFRTVPHHVMVGVFGAVSLFVLAALVIGCSRAWRGMGETAAVLAPSGWKDALASALSLKYLSGDKDGGGIGCSSTDQRRSGARRIAHHLTFYGFLLCLAATIVATVYDFGFGWHAPYGRTSLPVVLGTLGGIGLLIGPALLFYYRRQADPALFDPAQAGLADALVVLLFLASLTGLLLLAFRATPAAATLLIVHLATVMTLFLTVPYGRFVHGFYRVLALVKFAREKHRPAIILGGGS